MDHDNPEKIKGCNARTNPQTNHHLSLRPVRNSELSLYHLYNQVCCLPSITITYH